MEAVGALLGSRLGGDVVGAAEGWEEGAADGIPVGSALGAMLAVGNNDGAAVGALDGADDGRRVGRSVGDALSWMSNGDRPMKAKVPLGSTNHSQSSAFVPAESVQFAFPESTAGLRSSRLALAAFNMPQTSQALPAAGVLPSLPMPSTRVLVAMTPLPLYRPTKSLPFQMALEDGIV